MPVFLFSLIICRYTTGIGAGGWGCLFPLVHQTSIMMMKSTPNSTEMVTMVLLLAVPVVALGGAGAVAMASCPCLVAVGDAMLLYQPQPSVIRPATCLLSNCLIINISYSK